METLKADVLVNVNVDVQNDFLPGGSLAVTDGDQVIEVLNSLNTHTRERGGAVIFTGDQHPETTPHFETWPVHCVAGTEGAAFHPDLDIQTGDIIVAKGTGQTDGYSGFEGATTDGATIETYITPAGRERVAVLIGGLATDYCVLNTALDALKVDPGEGEINVFVVRDAMRAVNIQPDDGEKAIKAMEAAGAIIVESVDVLTGRALEIAG